MKVAIIGGGASGFFTAVNLARRCSGWEVCIYEKGLRLLSKVKVSGGGRCNVTHDCPEPRKLSENYPRGKKQLQQLFKQFGPEDTAAWFAERGVGLKVEADGRMFPESNRSQTIIDTFMKEAEKYGVGILTRCGLKEITQTSEGRWLLELDDGQSKVYDKVVIATGGQPSMWRVLGQLGLKIIDPVPSLFTFDCKDDRIEGLQGVGFPHVQVRVAGTKLAAEGPLLITHWGFSGPVILRLSAWGARVLSGMSYEFSIIINFLGNQHPESIREDFMALRQSHPKKIPVNQSIKGIPRRYWQKVNTAVAVREGQTLSELSKKQYNKIIEELSQAVFPIRGKSTFKEEFVTSGGVALSEIDFSSMEARRFPGLFFTGEVLDIDAITGGFNFQACWTTAWVTARYLSQS